MKETVDVLNREQFIDMLYQLVNTMSDLKQGKIFSIDGTWGYGKTYVLEELERRLSPVVNEDTYDDKFYVFHYNCWQYDYYEEPSVAIISAMLEASENSLEHRINKVAKAGWETAKEILTEVAGEYVKNKIGVNIVEIFQSETAPGERKQEERPPAYAKRGKAQPSLWRTCRHRPISASYSCRLSPARLNMRRQGIRK